MIFACFYYIDKYSKYIYKKCDVFIDIFGNLIEYKSAELF